MSYDTDVLGEATLVSYWKGDDSGSTAVDSKGTNTGTYTGSPSLVAGLITDGAQCHDYDGSTQYIAIAGAASLQPASITVEAWVNIDTFASADRRVISLADNCYAMYVNGTGKLCTLFWNGTANRVVTSTASLSAGVTYHVAASWDNTGDWLTTYINGVADSFTQFVGESIAWDATTTSAIATEIGHTSSFDLDGRIAKVAVYSSELSDVTLLAHYTAGTAAAAAPTLYVTQSNLRLG